MRLGILGLPRAGKSTLFDLLSESFDGPDFSHAPNKPRVKAVKVKDPRLERLRDDYSPQKYTPASLELFDFPAVAREGSSSSGLADLLAPAREMEALIIVCRAFRAPGLPEPDVLGDLEEVRGEFILADLVIIERRLERLEAKSRKPAFTKDDAKEQELLARLKAHLDAEKMLAELEFGPGEAKMLGGFGLLSSKPLVVAVNKEAGGDVGSIDDLRDRAGCEALAIDALNELEILQLPEEERQVFLEEYGISELSRERLIALGYRAAGRISFFTAGDKEVRAWTIIDGELAVEAAEEIHSDIARGFIRAEVVGYSDYVECGGIKGAKEKGQLRLEGKEYRVRDGDIVEFRFSV